MNINKKINKEIETSFEQFDGMKFKIAIDKFYKLKEAETRSTTVKYYDGKLPVIKEYLGEYNTNDIDEHVIADFTLYLKQRKTEPCNRTINYYREIVTRIIKRITGRKIIIKKLKETKPSIEGIKDVNIKKIFNYYNMHIEQYSNLKYYLIAKLLYDTGVRLNELINVKIANIDIPLRCIYLANSKTGEPRFVFFKESTRTLLNSYLNKEDEDTPYLFPSLDGTGHIRGESIYRAFRRLQRRLEIKQSISPHKFRHTFAQLYLLNGGNTATLQKYLGHSELSTTEMYLRFNKEYLKEMYDKTMIDVRGEADGRK